MNYLFKTPKLVYFNKLKKKEKTFYKLTNIKFETGIKLKKGIILYEMFENKKFLKMKIYSSTQNTVNCKSIISLKNNSNTFGSFFIHNFMNKIKWKKTLRKIQRKITILN